MARRTAKTLPFTPGSTADPWREYWVPHLNMYVREWQGKNKRGVEVSSVAAWTVEQMLPNPHAKSAEFRGLLAMAERAFEQRMNQT